MIEYRDVQAAQARIAPHIVRTPLLRVPALDEALGCQVYLKHEGFQTIGAFKLRGALNKALSLSEEELGRGLVCASSGNHAQGVAYAAHKLGTQAVIVMPTNANPVKLADYYSRSGADELVFYDITASFEGRKLFTDILTAVASTIFIPLTVGGGINGVEDFERVLACGADKVSVNSGAIKRPELIGEAAKRYGDQCVVLSVDAKRVDGKYHVFLNGGRVDTGMDALEWIKEGVDRGAGEVVVNSIDTDGVKKGFDIEMLRDVSAIVKVPVIASGGAGGTQDFVDLFRELPQLSAGLAASIFHFGEVAIPDLKAELRRNGVCVRL
mgnify:CR=1 FL=1